MLKDQLEKELADIALRKETTLNGVKLFNNQSKIRLEKTHSENENYLSVRVKEQNDFIHKLEYQFESKRNEFDNEYHEFLEVLQNNREFQLNEAADLVAKNNQAIEAIQAEAATKIEQVTATRREKEEALQEVHTKNSNRLDVKDRNHRTSISNAMYEKTSVLETSNNTIQEDINNAKSKYEKDKKEQSRNYELSLNKAIEGINSRLKQDLSTVI